MVISSDHNLENMIPGFTTSGGDALAREKKRPSANKIDNSTNSIAFLSLLFDLMIKSKDKDEDLTDKKTFDDFITTLGMNETDIPGLFNEVKNSKNPLQTLINNPVVTNFIQHRYDIADPVTVAKSARDIFVSNHGDAWEGSLQLIAKREGYRNDVYKDSEGHLTVGVGHLVKPGDGLHFGDTISDEQVMAFLKHDASAAYEAAVQQAKELGMEDKNVVIGLASVNYQLGLGWRKTFDKTWAKMKSGDFEGAINNVEHARWNKQTPVRVDDFQKTLARAAAIRDGQIQLAALDSTPEKTTLQQQFASGGKPEGSVLTTAKAAFTQTMQKGGTDQVIALAAAMPASNNENYNPPAKSNDPSIS